MKEKERIGAETLTGPGGTPPARRPARGIGPDEARSDGRTPAWAEGRRADGRQAPPDGERAGKRDGDDARHERVSFPYLDHWMI